MTTGNPTPWAGGQEATRPRLRGRHRCDVVVIGAGLTGLATALELLTLAPELTVRVVEADRVAAGASGRGTGLLGPRLGPSLQVARKRYGDQVARAAHLWSVAAVRTVLDLVERHRIDCDLTPGGQLVVAPDERALAHQLRERDAARLLGLPPEQVEFVDRELLPPVARRYLGGLRYGPAATLDPAALTERLARAGERLGLVVHESSQVRSVRRGLLATVVTDGGELIADQVVVAVNAYGGALAEAPAGVLGVRVQAGVTEKLSAEQLAALAGLGAEPLIEHGELAPYFRLTADGRLVVGGGAVERGPHGGLAPRPGRLLAAVRGLSPVLADVALDSTWAGPVAVTRDGLPVLGADPADPWLHRAGGCNGHGLAVSVHHGTLLARRLVGAGPSPGELPWLRPDAPWLPGGRVAGRLVDRYLDHLTAAAAPAGPRYGSAAPAASRTAVSRTENPS
ncbi:NAD(P)/FAD-dependent oxidoreductase [Streptomyces sp. NPDC090025]|uniref:NAD(P)/FAD-dependent oxidoreductase n=1 Tax=Streptomyces sp. NPDC090025 TaxID=3365922 RepID=UPI0038367452